MRGSVLESWDVYVCLGVFRRVGMCMCAWVCFGELGCVCVLGSVFESWDVYVCLGQAMNFVFVKGSKLNCRLF